VSRLLNALHQEYRAIFNDPAVLVIVVGGSLFYALFYPLPYQPQVATDLPIAVVDHDGGASARRLFRWLDATEQVEVVVRSRDLEQVRAAVRRKELAGYIEIPRDFGRRILRGEPARIGVFANAAYLVYYSQVANAAASTSMGFNAEIIAQRLLSAGQPASPADALATPVMVDLHELYNPDGGYANYVVPAVLILILQQTFLIGISMVQVARPGSAGAPALPVFVGRMMAYLGLKLALFVFYLTVVYRVFGFPHLGSFGLATMAVLPGFIAVIGLGLALGRLFASRETALQVMMLVSVPALFLAGFAWPAAAMPEPLVALGRLLPSTGTIDAFIRVYQMGAGLDEIRSTWLQLWALAVVYGLAAWLLPLSPYRAQRTANLIEHASRNESS
jgi:ABC-2 type transport system permease protein